MRARSISIPSAVSLVLLLFMLTAAAKSSAEPLSVNDYHLLIQESLAYLAEKEGRMQPGEIAWLRERFPPELAVRDTDGEPLLVDRTDLLHWLQDAEDSPQSRDSLSAYLQALSQQISQDNGGMFLEKPGWDESRKLLNDVYRGEEFLHLSKREEPAWKEYLQKLHQALIEWLKEHLGFIGGIQGRWFRYLIYGVVLMLGTILIIWIIRLFGPVGWRWQATTVSSPVSVKTSPGKDWRTWRSEAHNKARQGAFREAIRALFISALMEGDQKGWWLYEPEATNREHLARVRDHAERHKALQRLIERYERAWYGLGQPGEKDFQDCERWVYRMEASA